MTTLMIIGVIDQTPHYCLWVWPKIAEDIIRRTLLLEITRAHRRDYPIFVIIDIPAELIALECPILGVEEGISQLKPGSTQSTRNHQRHKQIIPLPGLRICISQI